MIAIQLSMLRKLNDPPINGDLGAEKAQSFESLMTNVVVPESSEPPSVFKYVDYRLFLNDFYEFRKMTNPQYSMSLFARKAGLGQSSRGYLRLVVAGKRNLSAHTIRRFIEAMGLAPKESLYFENLVLLNQAKSEKDKDFYLKRLTLAAEGKTTRQFEIMVSQYHYFSHWYYVVIRELVALRDFQADPGWISQQLGGRITKRQAQEALSELEKLELIKRMPDGKVAQSQPVVTLPTGGYSQGMQKFHLEMMERAKEAILEKKSHERHTSSVTVSCNFDLFPEIVAEIDRFSDHLCLKFGDALSTADSVIQINFQTFKII